MSERINVGDNILTIDDEDEDGVYAYLITDTLILHAEALYDGGYIAGSIDVDLRELLKKLNLKIVEDTERE